MKVWGVTDKGKVRKENQDSFHAELIAVGDVAAPVEFAVCAVCDGMGGAKYGNIASSLAIESFIKVIGASLRGSGRVPESVEIRGMLADAVGEAASVILTRARNNPDCGDMGTTLVAAIGSSDGRAVVVNIGDSRCYLFKRADGSIEQLTKDHSLVEDMVDRGEIKREEARYHPNRNLITRVLSANANTEPDFFYVDLTPGDMLLLCSDGLSNEADSREIAFELTYGDSETAAQRCLDIALERGAADNVTVVILEL